VDDDPDVGHLKLFFESDGHFQVRLAADGFTAGQQVVEFMPDVVILDLMMPRTRRLLRMRQHRKSHRTSSIRIVVLTDMPRQRISAAPWTVARTCAWQNPLKWMNSVRP